LDTPFGRLRGGDFAGGIRFLAPRGKTLARRRQESRRDLSGADGLAGHRRGRRLRLSLVAELIDAGLAPRELAQELGLNPVQFDISKYDENQPRVPAGSGRESGQWTSGDAAAGGDASSLVEGRSASANGGVHQEYTLPNDAVAVTRPDGTTIGDPDSTAGKLMAPPRANFQEVYAAGERIANWPLLQQIDAARTALQQFGTYDFQRDKATNTWFFEYVHAANYAVGVYLAGAGTGYINPSPLPKSMLSSIHQTHLTTNIKDANGK
jgi:hypothetical protein